MESREIIGPAGRVMRDGEREHGGRTFRISLVLTDLSPPVDYVSTAHCLAFDGDRIVLVNHVNRDWTIPGGHLEPGETALDAMRREAREEAGIEVSGGRMLGYERIEWIGGVPRDGRYPSPSFQVFFLASVRAWGEITSTDECTEARLFAPAEAREAPGWMQRNGPFYEAALQIATEPSMRIRDARADDGPELQAIERAAGERFREVGLPKVADDPPASLEELAAYAAAGRAWVAVDPFDVPVGYVLVDHVDGCAHIEQVTVRPDRQGERIGRALLDRVRTWAVSAERPAMTLTTYTDIPWNRPLYEHLGFEVIPDEEIGAGLRAVRDAEARAGLDPEQRVCMRQVIHR